ncbi:MAG: hypothetical protein KKA48_06725, partial [Proteobacteria bacterium]|nr:hypothetical protein [Pseudomonadota bacterium]
MANIVKLKIRSGLLSPDQLRQNKVLGGNDGDDYPFDIHFLSPCEFFPAVVLVFSYDEVRLDHPVIMDDIEHTMGAHRLSDAILIDIAIFGKESDDFGDIGRFDLNHQIYITSHPRYRIDSHRHRAGHHVRDIGGIKPRTYQLHEFDLFIHASMTVLAFSFYSQPAFTGKNLPIGYSGEEYIGYIEASDADGDS